MSPDLQKHGPQRRGQRAFNSLVRTDPRLAELIRGGPCDPFYDDHRLQVFETVLQAYRLGRMVGLPATEEEMLALREALCGLEETP